MSGHGGPPCSAERMLRHLFSDESVIELELAAALPSVDPAPVVMVVPPRADTDLGPGFLGIMRHLLSDDGVIEPEALSTPCHGSGRRITLYSHGCQ